MTDRFLSREDTKVLKGIAVLLMLTHHLWGFPQRIAGGELRGLVTLFDISGPYFVAIFAKICVSTFFFLGGYGTWMSSRNGSYDAAGRIKGLYLSFWKVFFLFVPLALLFFRNQSVYCADAAVCNRYADVSWTILFRNLFAVDVTFNSEWWFLLSYAVALMLFPAIRGVIEKHTAKWNLFFVALVSIVSSALYRAENLQWLKEDWLFSAIFCQPAPYISCFWMGMVCAKDGLLDRLQEGLKKNGLLNPVADVGLLFAVVFLRTRAIGDGPDLFFVPVVCVVTVDFLARMQPVRRFFLQMGRRSTNMWLIHTFFCYYFGAVSKLVTVTGWALPSLVTLVILTFAASVGVDWFWMQAGKLYRRIRR